MKFKTSVITIVFVGVLVSVVPSFAQELEPITLPAPQKTGGMPLMEALSARQTAREFSPDKLPLQILSDLLWAAFGVNRETMGESRGGPKPGRTAPSAMNLQEIDIYITMPEGVYLYEAVPHRLTPVLAKDVRAMTNRRPAAGIAPVTLIYVENTDRMPQRPASERPAGSPPPAPRPTSGEVDTGFIGQNVYLFCASAGLAAWFHGTDREGLAKELNLQPTQHVLYGQTIGYPEK